MYPYSDDLIAVARHLKKSGYEEQAIKILKLSEKDREIADTLKTVFLKEFSPDLSQERANNIACGVLWHDNDKDGPVSETIKDMLLSVNGSHYAKERTRKLTQQRAWYLAQKSVEALKKKRLVPPDSN